MRALLPILLFLSACCGEDAPVWTGPDPVALGEDERVTIDLAKHVVGEGEGLAFTVEAEDGVLATVTDTTLALVAERGFSGETSVTLTAEDACGNLASTELDVLVGGAASACPTTFTYTAQGDADQVFVAGAFNEWDAAATPLTDAGGLTWSVTLDLAPGAYPYKFVEADYTAGTEAWACDPAAGFAQCDEGYTWDPSCPLNAGGCNSLVVVEDCSLPTLSIASLSVDRDADTVSIEVTATGDIASATATLDGVAIEAWDGTAFRYTGAVADGRHTLRFDVTDRFGRAAEQLYVPFWTDDRDWESGLMYYVFVDRFADGDPTRNTSEGTSHASTDYVGGDWQGVIDELDYLDALGVTVIWLTAPQDNAEGAWGTTCNATYSGYHGYWPADSFGVEEHFGDEATLRLLVDEAHARGMRVLTDWVGNHVHVDHPYYAEHPEWFNDQALCGDANNWNDIPETCWFDSFLPDVRYYDTEPLVRFVDDAVEFAKDYGIDGYRVDAVKHMPHSVFFNFATRAREEFEHVEDFYTVGETYSGDRGLILSYVGEDELDGQFDFPVYWAIVAAFAREEIGLSNGDGSLQDTFADSEATFAGHLMSTFLGNHDVARFIPQATGEIASLYGDSACEGDGLRTPDTAPGWSEPYQRLMLAWSFLLTSEGLPLVYYGDEIGLPGFNDPDNRQAMRFGAELSADEAMVLAHVQALGQARRDHPSFSKGDRVEWWGGEAGFYAYARTYDDDAVLVLLNRDMNERTVTNGLAFAGLPSGTWRDVLTGDTFASAGDSLSVTVPALGSRVLVPE